MSRTFAPCTATFFALSLSIGTSQAATIVTLENVSPDPAVGNTLVFGTVSDGTPTSGTVSFPVNPADHTGLLNSDTYAMSLTGLTIDGISGIDLTWDMTVTASAGDGVAIDGGGTKTWVVDDPAVDETDPFPAVLENNRINAGETLTFAVSNIVATAPASVVITDATFTGFTDMNVANVGTAGVFTPGITGVVSHDGTGTDFRALQADFGFSLSAVRTPEPSTAVLCIFGLVGLAARRRRNRR